MIKKILIISFVLWSGFLNFTLADNLININTADLETLDTLPGIGASKAQAIVNYRVDNGFFDTIEEVMDVSGIGQATYGNMKDLITVSSSSLMLVVENDSIASSVEEVIASPGDNNVTQQDGSIENEDEIISYKNYLLGDVVINEFVSDPADGEVEWVELFNNTSDSISLSGWNITEGSGKITPLDDIIYSRKYVVIEKPKGNLNNKGDVIALRDGNSNLVDQVAYGNWNDGQKKDNAPVVKDPLSVARKIDGYTSYNNEFDFLKTEEPTPGKGNIITNHELIITDSEVLDTDIEVITQNLSSSTESTTKTVIDFVYPSIINVKIPAQFISTTTLIGDKNYFWDFGDGIRLNLINPEHTFFNVGEYEVVLRVVQGESEYEVKKSINIVDENKITTTTKINILINEILPNPVGADSEGEWIELYNNSQNDISLSDWKIDDDIGGSRPYIFDEDVIVGAGDFFLLSREDTGLALNNSSDKVVLFDENGDVADELSYDDVLEGESLARDDNSGWQWTTVSSPGNKNTIKEVKQKFGSKTSELDSFLASGYSVRVPNMMSIEQARQTERGEYVLVEGVVISLPGVLGSQYFYIVQNSGAGIQIYSYKKEFPELAEGDVVEVVGEISEINGEKRIKTNIKSDIIVVGKRGKINSQKISCENIVSDIFGSLLAVEGEVIDKKASSIYLDDGTDEIKVFIKKTTGINYQDIKTGDIIRVSGVLNLTRTGIRLLPRGSADIEVVKKDTLEAKTNQPQVLGETETREVWELEKRDKKSEFINYFIVLTIAGIVAGIGFYFRRRMS